MKIATLKNTIQEYLWGSETALANMLGLENREHRPMAELWLGAHPKAPSKLEMDGGLVGLDEAIRRAPEALLGEQVTRRFGVELPFLFKVLAAAKPLSVQVHPNLAQAREGYEREDRAGIPIDAPERNYRDKNHKPELICALTPFTGFVGFRTPAEILSMLQKLESKTLDEMAGVLRQKPDAEGLSAFYGALMSMPESRRQKVLEEALAGAKRHVDDPSIAWVLKLSAEYPGDIGAISPCLLNLVRLEPGEGIFLGANQLHFYAEGVGMELMANSDNVLRGGLTKKHVDVPELLRILSFDAQRPEILRPDADARGLEVYRTPAAEFELSRIVLGGEKKSFESTRSKDRSIEILFVSEGSATLTDVASGGQIPLARGRSVVVPASTRRYRIQGEAQIFRATVPVAGSIPSPEVEAVVRELKLDLRQVRSISSKLTKRIAEGLQEDGREIPAMPAMLPPPPRGLSGRSVVIDFGGTNVRAAVVEIDPLHGPRVVERSLEIKVSELARRVSAAGDRTGERLFDELAEMIASMKSAKAGLPLGFCFSFPAEMQPDRDARLLHWTKDIDIPGVVGTAVGSRLAAALEKRGLAPSGVAVENDTVACLVGGAGVSGGEDASRSIALIVGTGTNMAGFYSPSQAAKLGRAGYKGKMAINLESGCFVPPYLTEFDRRVDGASEKPGSNRYEKALSGRYLPQLFKAIFPDSDFDPADGAGALVAVRESSPDAGQRAVASALLDRSADLVAAGLAATMRTYGRGSPIQIIAEGSLMWKTPGYAERVEETLRRLLATDRALAGQEFEIVRVDDANLIGAAIGALTPNQSN